MNIIFKNILLKNFMSFSEAEIELNENGFVLISGINNSKEDNAMSNGSGKSTICDAIAWCLTGDTIRGSKDVARHGSEDSCYVQLQFSCDQNDYKIIRFKNPSNLKLFVEGKDVSGKGIRDTEKILSEYFPDLTCNLINSVIILGQGLPFKFSSNTPAGRKDILEKLSQSDYMIEQVKDRISHRANDLNSEIRKCEDDELRLSTEKRVNESSRLSLETRLDELNLVDIESVKNSLSSSQDEMAKFISELGLLSTDEVRKKQNEVHAAVDQLNYNYNLKRQNLEKIYSGKLEPITENYNSIDKKQYSLNLEIKKLESIKDTCPTCGRKLDGVEKVDTTEMHKESNELLQKLKDIQNEKISIQNEYKEKLNELSNNSTQDKTDYLESLNKLEKEEREIIAKKNDLQSKVNSLKTKINEYTVKIDTHTDKINSCVENINTLSETIKKIDSDLLYINTKCNNLKSHLEIVNKFSTAVKRDFRGYLLSNVIEFINISSKHYCKMLFDTENISFTLDGNNIEISYLDKEYESLSGGERQKIDLCIQFALRDMLSQFLNFSSNILILDEITDNLDLMGCQKVINLITNEFADINSVYIISHRPDLNIPCDSEIIITKDEQGISTCRMN